MDFLDILMPALLACVTSGDCPRQPDPPIECAAKPTPTSPPPGCSGATCRAFTWSHNCPPRHGPYPYQLTAQVNGIVDVIELDVGTPSYACGTSGCSYYYPYPVDLDVYWQHTYRVCPIDETTGEVVTDACSDTWEWWSS